MMRKLLRVSRRIERHDRRSAVHKQRDAFRFWATWLARIPTRLSDYLRTSQGRPGDRRLIYSVVDRVSMLFLRFPLLQLVIWGFMVIRTGVDPNLGQQATCFPGYFRTTTFRVVSYFTAPESCWATARRSRCGCSKDLHPMTGSCRSPS